MFAEAAHYAENELLLPPALRVPGCVCGARHPPGPALASPPLPPVHHPVGRRTDPGLSPRPHHLNLSWNSAMDEQRPGASGLRGPVLPPSSVRHLSLDAGAAHRGGTMGVAQLGEGRWTCFTVFYVAIENMQHP